ASNGQSGEPAPDQPPGTPAGQPQVHQTEERAGLLAKSGGIEGVLKVLSAMGEGAVERATAVQMLVLFYGLDQAAAEKLIGQSGQKQEPPPGAAPPGSNGNGDGTANRIAELVGKALIHRAEVNGAQPAGGADGAAETAPVPPIAQGTNWTCGPAALLAVCERFGIGATEESVAELAGT